MIQKHYTLGKIAVCIQYINTCTVSHALIKMLKINVNWTVFYKKESLFAICLHIIYQKLVVKWGADISMSQKLMC